MNGSTFGVLMVLKSRDCQIDKPHPEVAGRVSWMPPVAPGNSGWLRPAYEERQKYRDPRKREEFEISE